MHCIHNISNDLFVVTYCTYPGLEPGGQNDCNVLSYLTTKIFGAFKMFLKISEGAPAHLGKVCSD